MRTDEISTLIKTFSEGVVKHRENMYSNHVLANQHFDEFRGALKKLVGRGEPGLSALAELFTNPRPVVRVITAMYLISYYPERAIPVLERELTDGGRMADTALLGIERWKRGLYIDPVTGKEKRV